jgi:hypothetical protein
VFSFATILVLADHALAYTVPGPEFLGQFVSLFIWIFVAVSSVMLWPIYALIRRFRGIPPAPPPTANPIQEKASEPTETP